MSMLDRNVVGGKANYTGRTGQKMFSSWERAHKRRLKRQSRAAGKRQCQQQVR